MQIKKLYEDENVVFGVDEDGKYWVMQPVKNMELTKKGLYIEDILKEIGIKENWKGYAYIIRATQYMAQDRIGRITLSHIYQKIAQEYGATLKAVEKGIVNAIMRCEKNERYQEIFRKKAAIGNVEFLTTLKNYIYR